MYKFNCASASIHAIYQSHFFRLNALHCLSAPDLS